MLWQVAWMLSIMLVLMGIQVLLLMLRAHAVDELETELLWRHARM
jgi:hypothetical protein